MMIFVNISFELMIKQGYLVFTQRLDRLVDLIITTVITFIEIR